MREIKFRAYDDTWKFQNGIGKMIYDYKNIWSHEFPVMQYTGFKDKNGTEIYEGDIIENGDREEDAHAFNTWIREVKWDSESGMWVGIEGEVNEVIGNIYDNGLVEKLRP